MEARRFDQAARTLAAANTRRGLLRRVAVLPLGGVLAVRIGEEPTAGRRKKRCLKPKEGPTQGLQEAIDAKKAGATLKLCAGTWTVNNTITINKKLTLRGAGAGQTSLDGNGANDIRVLRIASGAQVTLQALKISGGNATGGGDESNGGGIFNDGTATLMSVTVTANTAAGSGGGIGNSGTLTLKQGSSVTVNTAVAGGGIANDSTGTVNLEAGSDVTLNTATGSSGSGIFNAGTVTLDSGALVCDNIPANNQCAGTFTGASCPNPAGGVCP
jgi:hypothetical protein